MESKPEDDISNDEIFACNRVSDGDAVIDFDVTLSQAEATERAYARRTSPGQSRRYLVSFEGWLLEHCMSREIRPIEALKEFQNSKSSLIRQIATKVLADKYAIFESDKINTNVAKHTKMTMWAAWAGAIIALLVYLNSCSSGGHAEESKIVPKAVSP